MISQTDRIKGVLFGQAIGDALGVGTEFMTEEEVRRNYPSGLKNYDEIVRDAHRSRWERGDWTDDTDMMLCIANALIADKCVNLKSIAQNFKAWAAGSPMGIGNHTHKVLLIADYAEKPVEVSKLVWELSRHQAAANGGVMRTSVVGLLPDNVERNAADICRLTHYDPRCVGSCVIVSEIIHSLVYDSVSPSYDQIVEWGNKYDERIKEFIDLAHDEDIAALSLNDGTSMGYTLKTLSAALWAYWHAKTFEDGLLQVVNASGDADTNAAVACAVLGAKFGYIAIPSVYKNGLHRKLQLEVIVEGLLQFLNI
ncbi:MAG: ADP-ribosylglycohydrolase family protein [Bacteroidales bacterium]|nr:ADP-ribosylglycohydrolase family protein [Bacteroidales bacterium]